MFQSIVKTLAAWLTVTPLVIATPAGFEGCTTLPAECNPETLQDLGVVGELGQNMINPQPEPPGRFNQISPQPEPPTGWTWLGPQPEPPDSPTWGTPQPDPPN